MENTTAATITSGGVLSAAQVTSNQAATVNASYTENGITKNTSMNVTITPFYMTSLSVQGAASVNAGDTSNYTATATYDDGSSRTVNAAFSLSPTTAATISSSGVLSAGTITSNQTVTVNASYTEGGITKTASMSVVIAGRIIPMTLTIQGAAAVGQYLELHGIRVL
ncbi:MAG: hypothetical protein ABSE08_16975 [Syntrophobacteraceae bacterium]